MCPVHHRSEERVASCLRWPRADVAMRNLRVRTNSSAGRFLGARSFWLLCCSHSYAAGARLLRCGGSRDVLRQKRPFTLGTIYRCIFLYITMFLDEFSPELAMVNIGLLDRTVRIDLGAWYCLRRPAPLGRRSARSSSWARACRRSPIETARCRAQSAKPIEAGHSYLTKGAASAQGAQRPPRLSPSLLSQSR